MTITSGELYILNKAADYNVHVAGNSWVGVQPIQYRAEDLEDSGDATKRYYIPTVSGIEASQYFLDKVAERHCVSGIEWEHVCGTYVPNITKPFNLTGYPINDLSFWRRYYQNIIDLGGNIGRDFSGVLLTNPYDEYAPYSHLTWANYASNPDWSGQRYYCNSNHDPYSSYSLTRWQRPIPSGMHEYGPMMQEDFHTFISKPVAATNPGMFGYATYNRIKSIEGLGFNVSVVSSPPASSTVDRARFGDEYGTGDICYGASGHVGVPITLGYRGDVAEFLFHEAGNSKYIYPSSVLTVTGVVIPNTDNAIVLYSGFEVIYETQHYHFSGVADFEPIYRWMLFDWGPEGSGQPIASGATITDQESWVAGGGLWGQNQARVSDVQALFTISPSGEFVGTDPIHLMSGIWTGPTTSGQLTDTLKFNISSTQKDRFQYFPMWGQNGKELGFRQLTGIIQSGATEAYGYQLIGAGSYDPKTGGQQQSNGGWAARISDPIVPVWGKVTDWEIPQGYLVAPDKVYLHAKMLNTAEEILDYLRGRDFNNIATFDYGPIHYDSGIVPEGAFFPRSDPFSTTWVSSGNYPFNNKKLDYWTMPEDFIGCQHSGRYLIVGLNTPLDSGQILPLTSNKSIMHYAYGRRRAKIKGQVCDAEFSSSGAFFYKCGSLVTVSNIRDFESGFGDWIYNDELIPYGVDEKLIFPHFYNSTVSITSSSNPTPYFGVGSMKMPIQPVYEIYNSSNAKDYFRM